MYKIHKVTPFGFIFELENDDCFFTEAYDVYLNGRLHSTTDKNVVCLYGLMCDTEYEIELRGKGIRFNVRTAKPQYLINIKDYNASGDGITDDTSSINMAIYTAVAGSVVYIPKGEYITGHILLRSDVDIYLEDGAIIKQSTKRDEHAILKGYQRDYTHDSPTKALINVSWEGHPLDCYCSIIYGKDIKNVHIYGEGTIDGNGDKSGFWVNPKIKNKAYRPKNILLVGCEGITVSGITSRNSASWNIHPLYCNGLSFLCLSLECDPDSPNTDGINPESSEDVDIIGCRFNVGDDCIAIKAGKYYMSVAHLRPTRNITVRNCLMEKGHGGVVIGSEMSCGVYGVTVTQCLLRETDRGLRIKTRRGRGKHAVADGITFANVTMENVRHCFVVNMFYFCDPDGRSDYVRDKKPRVIDEYTPTVKNITVTGVNASGITGSAVFIYGLPENKVSGVSIVGNTFSFAPNDKRICECPAMMDDFEITEHLDFFTENVTGMILNNNKGIGSNI
ncbi:MAG: glycoside hydrolase family 28 protein [Defluviitaleaceae bacterium]|nr:glycoside hydrolase family 28 protein [Defluviitaleaceae bacterium]